MANPEHLAVLNQGVDVWNGWREQNLSVEPDLSGAHLVSVNLPNANLSRVNLANADLALAHLTRANLFKAILIRADFIGANLMGANLRGAHLNEANLSGAYLTAADLSEANLMNARLAETNLQKANITNCRIYGISTWGLHLEDAIQSDLVITRPSEPTITVDNLEVAQFVYLLLNNEKIRGVIETVARKVVLILGRFSSERKVVLDAIRDELRKRDYLPVLFDFDKPAARNITETVRTLAHLSRFVIADLTDPSSIPQELYAIVPTLAVPIQPVLERGKREYSMFVDLRTTYHWVLPIHEYQDTNDLLASLGSAVIAPAEAKAKELEKR